MNKFFEKIKLISLWKKVGLFVVAFVILAILSTVVMAGLNSARGGFNTGSYPSGGMGSSIDLPDFAPSPLMNPSSSDNFKFWGGGSPQKIASRDSVSGIDAENFEVAGYSASVRTWQLKNTCDSIESLKKKKEIIFEKSLRYDHGCKYSFKVEKPNAEVILAFIKNLQPETLQESIETIQSTIEHYQSEEETLIKKLESSEQIFDEAQNSYTQVQALAVQAQNIPSLTLIIQNKTNLINQMVQEQLKIRESLGRIAKEKAKQLDSLQYAIFNIDVSEIVLIDGKNIKNAWIYEVADLVKIFNDVLRGISIGLFSFGLYVLRFAVYLMFVVFVTKYGWVILNRIWNSGKGKLKDQKSSSPIT